MTVRLSVLLLLTLLVSSCGNKLNYVHVRSEEKCDCKKDSYWYNSKCWKNYQNEAISIRDIDSVVKIEIAQSQTALITIDEQTFPIDVFFPIPEDKVFVVLTEFTDESGRKSMIS